MLYTKKSVLFFLFYFFIFICAIMFGHIQINSEEIRVVAYTCKYLYWAFNP